jgi:hypothetical protein
MNEGKKTRGEKRREEKRREEKRREEKRRGEERREEKRRGEKRREHGLLNAMVISLTSLFKTENSFDLEASCAFTI